MDSKGRPTKPCRYCGEPVEVSKYAAKKHGAAHTRCVMNAVMPRGLPTPVRGVGA